MDMPKGPPAVPRATVRLQMREGFGFAEAAELVPYFASLGISHIYSSPFLLARSGSTHGYDIIAHGQFNPEIGSAEEFEHLVDRLHAHNMGLILDFVPNHMGIGGHDNPWWLDVLEWGQASPYASFFDIEWNPVEDALRGKVLLPVLGDHYGAVLERGELQLRLDEERGSFSVWYYDHRFPVALREYARILAPANQQLGEAGAELLTLVRGFERIEGGETVAEQALLRRDVDALRRQLAALVAGNEAVRAAIADAAASFNGTAGDPGSFVGLHRLLERQAYRLAYWRVASDEINYRRFFDVNDLAGLRIIENPELFELAHSLVFRLIGDGQLQGVRLDHVDGLFDPAAYCHKLQERAGYLSIQAASAGRVPLPSEQPELVLRQPMYLLVEKILAPHERLREDWPVSGTTGYEFMNLVNGLFVDPAGEEPLTRGYQDFIGREVDYEEMVVECKRLIITNHLASELKVLSTDMYRLAQQSWTTRDYTLTGIRRALVDIAAHFPVYRTYVTGDHVAEEDRRYIDWAVNLAKKRTATPDTSVYEFLRAVLTTDLTQEERRGYRREDVMRVAMKFQQFTGPVTAKSVEDTAFYRYFRLVSLNEVGGEPGRWATSLAAFHRVNEDRLQRHPFAMVATATHDHKRGEDTRVRIDVLSEIAADWDHHVRRWSRMNRLKRRELEGRPAPGRNDEYLLYQTLVGAWPLDLHAPGNEGMGAFAERIVAYMLKAVRESKYRSSWTGPDADYEAALESFVRGILDPAASSGFLADLMAFQARIAIPGAINGLAQTLLRLTVPGVPDLYQGTEFWDLSLVDPDNRAPPDYDARRQGLAAEDEGAPDPDGLLASWRNGRIKQHLVASVLRLRRSDPALFALGDYRPVEAAGEQAERVIAFLRRNDRGWALVVAPRLVVPLLGEGEADRPMIPPAAWGDTRLLLPMAPSGLTFTDALSGGRVGLPEGGVLPVADALSRFPVALLHAREG